MPVNMVKSEADEKLWSRASAQASEQGHAKNWPYITSIFQSMKKASVSHVLITGVPGAGKTTLARQRSDELGIPHVELDEYLRKSPMNALDAIKSIREPSVIDGVQILKVDPSELTDHKIETLDAPDKRLMDVFLESGSWSGHADQEEKIREAIARARLRLNEFKAGLPISQKTAWHDKLIKFAREHPITEAENDAISLKKDPSNPFSLFEDKDPERTRQATEEMKGLSTTFLSDTHDWAKKYRTLGAGDTAVFDRLTQYMNANMRTGWEDIFSKNSSVEQIKRTEPAMNKLAIKSSMTKEAISARVARNHLQNLLFQYQKPAQSSRHLAESLERLLQPGRVNRSSGLTGKLRDFIDAPGLSQDLKVLREKNIPSRMARRSSIFKQMQRLPGLEPMNKLLAKYKVPGAEKMLPKLPKTPTPFFWA